MTCDNGKEFVFHQEFPIALQAECFSSHPYQAWNPAKKLQLQVAIHQIMQELWPYTALDCKNNGIFFKDGLATGKYCRLTDIGSSANEAEKQVALKDLINTRTNIVDID